MYSASSLCSEEKADTIVNMKDLGDLVEEVNNKMVKGEGERLTRSTRQDIKLKKTCHLLLDLDRGGLNSGRYAYIYTLPYGFIGLRSKSWKDG